MFPCSFPLHGWFFWFHTHSAKVFHLPCFRLTNERVWWVHCETKPQVFISLWSKLIGVKAPLSCGYSWLEVYWRLISCSFVVYAFLHRWTKDTAQSWTYKQGSVSLRPSCYTINLHLHLPNRCLHMFQLDDAMIVLYFMLCRSWKNKSVMLSEDEDRTFAWCILNMTCSGSVAALSQSGRISILWLSVHNMHAWQKSISSVRKLCVVSTRDLMPDSNPSHFSLLVIQTKASSPH